MTQTIAHCATLCKMPSQHFDAHGAFADFAGFGQRQRMQLATIRMLRGLSQRDLGEMIGKDASTVQRAEVMAKTAKLATYQACADALGVTLSDLFSDARTPIEMALLDVFRRIPAERHDELLRLLALAANPPAPGTR